MQERYILSIKPTDMESKEKVIIQSDALYAVRLYKLALINYFGSLKCQERTTVQGGP